MHDATGAERLKNMAAQSYKKFSGVPGVKFHRPYINIRGQIEYKTVGESPQLKESPGEGSLGIKNSPKQKNQDFTRKSEKIDDSIRK